MKILNCTPHPVNLLNEANENIVTFLPAETPVRLKQKSEIVETVDIAQHIDDMSMLVPLSKTSFGKVENLPESQKDTLIIVSRMVKTECKDRLDLIVPDNVVLKNGKIIGCKSFAIN